MQGTIGSVRGLASKAFVLGLAGALGGVAALPYTLELLGASLGQVAAEADLPVGALFLLSLGQGFVVYTVVAFFGLQFAGASGLRAPVVDAIVTTRRPAFQGHWWAVGIGTGLVGGGAVWLVASVFPGLPSELHALPVPRPISGLMAALHGAIGEELIGRLLILSLVLAVLRGTAADEDGRQTPKFWVANVVAALAFGALHAPALVLAGVPLTPAVWAYLLTLNGGIGVAFGWLYARYGLEVAMLGHFVADVLLHAIAPALL